MSVWEVQYPKFSTLPRISETPWDTVQIMLLPHFRKNI